MISLSHDFIISYFHYLMTLFLAFSFLHSSSPWPHPLRVRCMNDVSFAITVSSRQHLVRGLCAREIRGELTHTHTHARPHTHAHAHAHTHTFQTHTFQTRTRGPLMVSRRVNALAHRVALLTEPDENRCFAMKVLNLKQLIFAATNTLRLPP